MEDFDPAVHIKGSELVLGAYGSWPEFHDAEIHRLNIWRGDMRPDDDVWIGPEILATIETTAAQKGLLVLRFLDCDEIELSGFNHSNQILDLKFRFRPRGFLTDGTTPLKPYVAVEFVHAFGAALRFVCFDVELSLPDGGAFPAVDR
jgi:hypothetical protein